MHIIKRIVIWVMILLLCCLILSTVLGKFYGQSFVDHHIYSSVAFVALWAFLSIVSLIYIIRCRLYVKKAVFFFHLSLLLILSGAFLTWKFGIQGELHLRLDEPVSFFENMQGQKLEFPFMVQLESFKVRYYEGTQAPRDYESLLRIDQRRETVSMNNVLTYKNYRFYQAGYDSDEQGAGFSIAYDPYGIALTYTGYIFLLISMIFFFFAPDSHLRQLLQSRFLRKSMLTGLMLFSGSGFMWAVGGEPNVLPQNIAEQFCNLYVLHNDRVCPVQTLAKDFTMKLYGKACYGDYSAEQVFTGFIFYYQDWSEVPLIKIKDKSLKNFLGSEYSYLRLSDFMSAYNRYKLEDYSHNEIFKDFDQRSLMDADEKFNLIRGVCSGRLLKIYPHKSCADSLLVWYSSGDLLPVDMPDEKWYFIKKTLDYATEKIILKRFDEVSEILTGIRSYQKKEAGDELCNEIRFKAEIYYNSLNCTFILSVLSLIFGFFGFLNMLRCMILGRKTNPWIMRGQLLFTLHLLFFLWTVLALRGYVSQHLPLSNGYETMQFMAAVVALAGVISYRKFRFMISLAVLLSGLILMVSVMGESNPQITPLMPVLNSPLLCIHVAVIMVGYSLLALIMMIGITGAVLHSKKGEMDDSVRSLHIVGNILLYPAVFSLAAGIFIGSVWANVSWGRYWGWDPKETWALITMLVYSFGLHTVSIPRFGHPLFFFRFSVLAFLCVIVTYFGVNYLLGGLHSYAG